MRILFAILSFLSVTMINSTASGQSFHVSGTSGSKLKATTISQFANPWAMTFISESQALITTKPGRVWLVATNGEKTEVKGIPKSFSGGQGGLGDVVIHPDFASNKLIYLSLVHSDDGGATRGAIVVRGKLVIGDKPVLTNIERIWTQIPKTRGRGHFSHRLVFGTKKSGHEGKLFITSGDRQEQTPAQKWDMALGKIIRLNKDGTLPNDNPFQDKGELARSFWSLGHRNPLGITFDADGRLWANEMGPRHGDELNVIKPGLNYGWPIVSYGDNYNGSIIPDHDTRPEFSAPSAYWVPSIAPSGLVIYSGDYFADWRGNAFIGGLVSRALIRVELDGENASEAERFEWRQRIREVEQGPDGAIYVLEDGSRGRLLRLTKP